MLQQRLILRFRGACKHFAHASRIGTRGRTYRSLSESALYFRPGCAMRSASRDIARCACVEYKGVKRTTEAPTAFSASLARRHRRVHIALFSPFLPSSTLSHHAANVYWRHRHRPCPLGIRVCVILRRWHVLRCRSGRLWDHQHRHRHDCCYFGGVLRQLPRCD